MPTLTIPGPDGDDIAVPATWEICDLCEGDGTSSAFLGAFSPDDWYDQSDDFREDYLAGRFDRPCEECSGSGKILVANEDAMTPEQRDAWADHLDYLAEGRHYAYLRERGIEY